MRKLLARPGLLNLYSFNILLQGAALPVTEGSLSAPHTNRLPSSGAENHCARLRAKDCLAGIKL